MATEDRLREKMGSEVVLRYDELRWNVRDAIRQLTSLIESEESATGPDAKARVAEYRKIIGCLRSGSAAIPT